MCLNMKSFIFVISERESVDLFGIYAGVYCNLYCVYDVVVKKAHVRYLIS